jgi:RNA polymerase sigma factor (sigma-70 family)
MNEEKLKLFDEFFVKNYKYLIGFTKSINPSHDYQNTLHDVYVKLRERIEVNGYRGTDFLNYTRCSLMNTYKSQYRADKKRQMVDIENPDYHNTIEQILLQGQNQQEQQNEVDNRNIYLNTLIYEYIDVHFTAKERFVFSTYYLLKHKHLNYKTLAEVTGYSITSVSNIIKRMKKDIRENLELYIMSGNTIHNE